MIGFRSIKSRILAFAVLATLVPSMGLGLLTYQRYQALVGGNVAVGLRTLHNYARSELSLWVAKHVDDLRALANANTILEGLSRDPPAPGSPRIGPREIEVFLRSLQDNLDAILELSVLDSAGKPVASSAAAPAPVGLPAAWTDRSASGGPVQLAPKWDSARATATMTVLVPIWSSSNALLGTLAAIVDLGGLQGRLDAIARTSVAEVVLITPTGTPLLGTHSAATGLARIDPQPLQDMQARPGEPVTYRGHRGGEVVGLTGRPGASPLWVIAERANADVNRERQHLLDLFARLTIALTVLVGISAYWIARSIVKPLEGLLRAVDQIADGDLSVHLRPTRTTELGRLVRAMNSMVVRLQRSHDEVEAAKQALEQQNRMLEELSVTDGLTGLYNRKKLDLILIEQFALFHRQHRPFALLMIDIDHFKSLNDRHGHPGGDQVLIAVAGALRRCIRSVDQVARYGGEEFAVVLVEATLEGALDTAQRIRVAVQGAQIVLNDQPVSVTISLGVTRCRDTDTGPAEVIARADGALYAAKHAGRNRVHCADAPDRAGEPDGADSATAVEPPGPPYRGISSGP